MFVFLILRKNSENAYLEKIFFTYNVCLDIYLDHYFLCPKKIYIFIF